MTSRERVLAALQGKEPDRVPYLELTVDRALAQELLGWVGSPSQAANLDRNPYDVQEAKAISTHLKLDTLYYILRAPVLAERVPGRDGRLFYGQGLVKSEEDLPKLQFPDPHIDSLYDEAKQLVAGKEDFAACFVTRIGMSSTMLSMGLENFSVALYEDRSLVERVLDTYCDWIVVVAERACQLGFDVFVSTDDLAYKTAPFFSPKIFHELSLPRYQRVREKITLPWIVHSDGNVLPLMDDFMSLDIAGLHPNEKGAMDIREMKRRYGNRLCLLGNVDLNLLGMGTPEAVEKEVRELIRDIAPGGGYIASSGNSLAGYLRPKNVMALSESVQKYGRYPIQIL